MTVSHVTADNLLPFTAVPHSNNTTAAPYSNIVTATSPVGGSVAEWLACWTQVQKGPGSNRSRDAVR